MSALHCNLQHTNSTQRSKLEVDHLPISLMLARSGHARDNKKVSCETLSNADWYSRRPHETELYYHSEGNESEKLASKAEVDDDGDDEDGNYTEGKRFAEKLEHHGHGEGFSAQVRHFLACFHPKTAYDNPGSIAAAGRDAKKVERGPRVYQGPMIPHSGSLQSSGTKILPHSGPIKLHVGSHASTSSKVSGSTRGSSLIPLNIRGKSSKSSGFGSANEPYSPKVTCLGRVKIKQKYCREMGRRADVAIVAAPGAEKSHKSIRDRMMKAQQRVKKAQEEEGIDVLRPRGEMQKDATADLTVRSKHGRKTDNVSLLSSAGAKKEHPKSRDGQSWASHAEKASWDDTASDSANKGKKGKWKTKESAAPTQFFSSKKKKCLAPDVSNAQGLQSDVLSAAIDLNRFHSSLDQSHTQDNRLSQSTMSMSIADELCDTGERDERQFKPQVPPSNSLLLMRSKRSKAACAILAASSLHGRPRAGSTEGYGNGSSVSEAYEFDASVSTQVHLSVSEDESLTQVSSSSQGADMVEGEQTHLYQTFFPLAPFKPASLWERRNVLKPADLEVQSH